MQIKNFILSRNQQRLNNFIVVCFTLIFSANVLAGKLGYVLRPDKGDIGLIDTQAHTIVGGLAASGVPLVVKTSPDGTFAYVGVDGFPMAMLDTLSSSLIELDDPSAQNALFNINAIVFHPDLNIAYLANKNNEFVSINTLTHEVINVWQAPNRGDVEALFLLDGNQLLVGKVQGQNNFQLLSLEDDSSTTILGNFDSEIIDLDIDVDGNFHALTERNVYKFAFVKSFQNIRIVEEAVIPTSLLNRGGVNLGALKQLDISLVDTTFFLGFENGVTGIQCSREIIKPPGNETEIVDCYTAAERPEATIIEITSFDLNASQIPNNRGIESTLTDMKMLEIGEKKQLFAIGRRAVAVIDASQLTIEKEYNLNSGGGYLGMLDFGNPVKNCTPESFTITGLIKQSKAINSDINTINKLSSKLNSALNYLRNDDFVNSRDKLSGFVGAVVWRSGLPPTDSRHIEPEDATSLICGGSNLLARIDAY